MGDDLGERHRSGRFNGEGEQRREQRQDSSEPASENGHAAILLEDGFQIGNGARPLGFASFRAGPDGSRVRGGKIDRACGISGLWQP